MKGSVAIIGCGWLGNALAQQLLSLGFDVLGTRQSTSGMAQLQQQGITAERVELPLEQTHPPRFINFETLIIMIPPQLRHGKTDYAEKIESVLKWAKQGRVAKLILINSTAIYEGLTGEVDETSVLATHNQKVALLARAEELIMASGLSAISLRVSGLVGDDRLPTNFFKQGRALQDGQAPVNLVHQKDVIGCILALLQQPELTGIFNINSRQSMTKQAFYQQAATIAGQEAPTVANNEHASQSGRFINSDKIRAISHYSFEYDDLLAWLASRFTHHK